MYHRLEEGNVLGGLQRTARDKLMCVCIIICWVEQRTNRLVRRVSGSCKSVGREVGWREGDGADRAATLCLLKQTREMKALRQERCGDHNWCVEHNSTKITS